MEKLLDRCLPRMRGNEAAAYRQRLPRTRRRKRCSILIQDAARGVGAEAAHVASTRADPLEHWSMALDARRCLGNVKVPITDRNGQQPSPRVASPRRRRACASSRRRPRCTPLALGKPFAMFETPVLIEALARCGEVKYGGVEAMDTLAKCVGGMVRNIIGQGERGGGADRGGGGQGRRDGGGLLQQRAEEARKANWDSCWKLLVVKDLPGWPMWEKQLHDILEPHFADLHSIFVHYCGSRSRDR